MQVLRTTGAWCPKERSKPALWHVRHERWGWAPEHRTILLCRRCFTFLGFFREAALGCTGGFALAARSCLESQGIMKSAGGVALVTRRSRVRRLMITFAPSCVISCLTSKGKLTFDTLLYIRFVTHFASRSWSEVPGFVGRGLHVEWPRHTNTDAHVQTHKITVRTPGRACAVLLARSFAALATSFSASSSHQGSDVVANTCKRPLRCACSTGLGKDGQRKDRENRNSSMYQSFD